MLKQQVCLPKQEILILILIIISASILRLWDLSAVGLNNDEAIYSGQAASLAGYDEFERHFSIYRAHPLLLQFIVSIIFANFGISDTVARIVPAIFGISTVILTYLIGKTLFDRKIAMVAALVIAILPYHIILSRQVLLDVPLSFFVTLTLYFVIRHMKSPREAHWLYLVGASAGLAFLSKEIGLFALIASIVCLFLIKTFSFKNLFIILSAFFIACSPYWIPIITVQEAYQSAIAYWHWQNSRDPNQPNTFYATIISQEALGYILTGLFILSIIHAVNKNIKKPSILLLSVWIAIPLTLFHFLAVKGYAFVLPTIPFFVLLATSFLFSDWMKKVPCHRIVILAFIPLIFVFSGPPLHYFLQIPPIHLVGSGGEPYSREGAIWIRDNISHTAAFLTLDTRTANVIKYYSNNDAYSLHSNENPAYSKVSSSDLAILNGTIGFLVYEVHLARQLPYLKEEAKEMNELVIKYKGIPIHTEYESYVGGNGQNLKPALIIYSLNPFKEN